MSEPTSRRAARDSAAPAPATDKANPTPRAGRNLYAAIGVGVALAILILVSLFVQKELFVAVAAAASVVATWEMLRALGSGGLHPPTIPAFAAAGLIPVIAYIWGPVALAVAVATAALVIIIWRSFGPPADSAMDVASGIFVVLYVPTLVSFALLLLHHADGPGRIVTFILVTTCSDIGGYAVGVLKGKHPMAPSVSPKKSWEGFAGSAVFCVLAGAISVSLILHGRWWIGALMGALVVIAATVGDLCESMIKRDLGIKDMSNLIPGHGGFMDRLDSLVIAAPVVWAILEPFVPVK